jgi:hypothetical protein
VKRFNYVTPRQLALVLGAVIIFVGFQNCEQPGDLGIFQNPDSVVNDAGRTVLPEYSETSLSSRPPPPLKLIFVMDNSNSMTLNNLNLQKSFSSMFSGNQDSLAQFDIDISFVTTAQVVEKVEKAESFFPTMLSFGDLTGSDPGTLQKKYRDASVFTGMIPGDLLGFRLNRIVKDNLDRREFHPQPVVGFQDSTSSRDPASLTKSEVLPSIKFRRGQSVSELSALVAARLETISPKLASGITNPAVFPIVDYSSGLCSLGRILKHQDSFFRKGDIVSFVLVSDHDEFGNPDGTECTDSLEKEFLYSATCVKSIGATTKNQTRIDYKSLAVPASVTTRFSITLNDSIQNKTKTTLTLTKPATGASCVGTQESSFTANYEVIKKSYVINYTKKPYLGTREGGVNIYGAIQTGLKTSSLDGNAPANCATDLAALKTALGDIQSVLEITSCSQNADTKSSASKTFSYEGYPSVNLSTSTACSPAILTAIKISEPRPLGVCSLVREVTSIPRASLTAVGFGDSSNQATCESGIAAVCGNSGGRIRACTFTSYGAPTAAVTRGPVSVTQNSPLNCAATCATFPGLCDVNDGRLISTFAASQGLNCGRVTLPSSETFIASYAPFTVTATSASALACSAACSAVSGACPGSVNSPNSISSMNKACSVTGTVSNPAVAAAPLSLTAFDDSAQSVTCDSACSMTGGVCSGSQKIKDYIASNGGDSCTVTRTSVSIPASTETRTLTKLKKAEIQARNYCPTDFSIPMSPLPQVTADFIATSNLVSSGKASLKDFILSQMKNQIGERAATLSAFITGKDDSKPEHAITYGALYEDLVKSWGHGAVNDIHSDTYSPALSELGTTLRDQLIRTVSFPNVTSPEVRIRKVWIRAHGTLDWGQSLDPSLWSASGNSVTLDLTVFVNANDEVKIQYY